MPERPFPARLHVLFRPETPLAVVIRRGPANAVCTLGWDRRSHHFELGQWMKARLYERRSDISPDGKYLLYFARNSKSHSETKGSWTAVALTPYLKALVLWGKGDTWQGGGLFTGRREYWLNGCHFPLRNNSGLKRSERFPGVKLYNCEDLGVYYNRLQRDGWELKGDAPRDGMTFFEKPAGPHWKLRKAAYADICHPPGRGCYYDEHELVPAAGGQPLYFRDWEWAEAEKDRLYWAEGGQLFTGSLAREGIAETRLLYDFNSLVFEPITAPY